MRVLFLSVYSVAPESVDFTGLVPVLHCSWGKRAAIGFSDCVRYVFFKNVLQVALFNEATHYEK